VKRLLPWLPVLSIVLTLPLTFACRKPPPPAPAALPGALGATTAEPPKNKPMPAQLPAIVAKVNGEVVERWELENAVHALEGRAGGQIPADKRDEVLRGLLDQLVSFHVLVQESRARKFDVSDGELESRLTELKQGFPSEQAFQQELASQGLTLEQLRFQARSSMQVSKLVDAEIKPKISVQDAEVDAYYKENLERFKQGETVHASHIMIGLPPNADAATKQQARAKAQQVLKEVRGGGDFAKLAAEKSNDPGSAAKGGDLGFFPKGQMEPVFEAAAFAVKPGGVSGIVETSFGFHIIKVHERRPARTAPFAEVSGQIKEFLAGKQRDAKLAEFADQAKAKRKVEMLV
jgi:peptidyl-prolyl cis-trans isomerase C